MKNWKRKRPNGNQHFYQVSERLLQFLQRNETIKSFFYLINVVISFDITLQLTKTENDVDNISLKLDQEFAALQNEVNAEVKLSEVMKNVRNLRSELERVTVEVEEFQKSQKEVMNEVRERLTKVSDQFESLQCVAVAAEDEGQDS
ncbi:hypothetical protein Avbf_07471 [Armadillidium vulgare]|nr:hypothetical protein Avbf_07471 [Armadillidium vulgare]